MTFRLRYGGTYLSFKLPKGFKPALAAAGRVKGPGMDARGAVQVALEEPIDGVRLKRLAGPGVKAALIVDDLTRRAAIALRRLLRIEASWRRAGFPPRGLT